MCVTHGQGFIIKLMSGKIKVSLESKNDLMQQQKTVFGWISHNSQTYAAGEEEMQLGTTSSQIGWVVKLVQKKARSACDFVCIFIKDNKICYN